MTCTYIRLHVVITHTHTHTHTHIYIYISYIAIVISISIGAGRVGEGGWILEALAVNNSAKGASCLHIKFLVI